MKSPNYKKYIFIFAVMISSIGIYGCGLTPTSDSADTSNEQTADNTIQNTDTTNTQANSNAVSSKETTYDSPGGQDSILVSLVLDNDKKITDVAIKYNASNHESQEYMAKFDQGIKSAILGKTIDQAKVDTINGASLTSAAFNEAISTIQI